MIDSMLGRFKSERKWVLQAIEQLSEDAIVWNPTHESNSIANIVAHIRGTVHQRIETIFYDIPDNRDREKEFERGLEMSKIQALRFVEESFDITIQYIEEIKSNPDLLIAQPYLHMPPLTYSAINNQATILDLLVQMVREVHFHTGQIIYIAKMKKGQLEWKYD